MSTIPFGEDASVVAGYAVCGNNRLGNIDLVVENTGMSSLYFKVGAFTGTTSPSGYANVGPAHTIVAGGTKTISMSVLSKKLGFFGSGGTTANVSVVIRNKSDLRGAQIDIQPMGRRGWGVDPAFDKKSFVSPPWGSPPDRPDLPPAIL